MGISFRDQSKLDYESKYPVLSNDQLQLGCLQRIAAATELIARNYQSLIDDRDYYKRRYEAERARAEGLERSNRAHKSNYTRLKKKYEAIQNNEKSD